MWPVIGFNGPLNPSVITTYTSLKRISKLIHEILIREVTTSLCTGENVWTLTDDSHKRGCVQGDNKLQLQNVLSPSSTSANTTTRRALNDLVVMLKPQSNGPFYSNTVIGTVAVGRWVVTFRTARRGLGALWPRPVPSSLYQM